MTLLNKPLMVLDSKRIVSDDQQVHRLSSSGFTSRPLVRPPDDGNQLQAFNTFARFIALDLLLGRSILLFDSV